MKHVLITGASTGIGRACALHLAAAGWAVHAGVRREQDGAELAAGAGGAIKPVLIDVVDTGTISSALDEMQRRVGSDGLAGLVNNAGIAIIGPVEEVPVAEWRRQFEVNVFGQVAVTQAFLPLLRRHVEVAGRGAARIVLMSSIAGLVGPPLFGPYSASKHALEAMGDALRLELGLEGIQVSLVEPGAVSSEIWRKGHESARGDEFARLLAGRYGAMVRRLVEKTREAEAGAISADAIARIVERCLTAARAPIRVVVGRDAKVAAFLKGILPGSRFDAVLRKAYIGI